MGDNSDIIRRDVTPATPPAPIEPDGTPSVQPKPIDNSELDKLKSENAKLTKDVEGKQGRIDQLTTEKYQRDNTPAPQPVNDSNKPLKDLTHVELTDLKYRAEKEGYSPEELREVDGFILKKEILNETTKKIDTAKTDVAKAQAAQQALREIPELGDKESEVYKELARLYALFPDTVKNDPEAVLKLSREAKRLTDLKNPPDKNKDNDNFDHTKGLDGGGNKDVSTESGEKLRIEFQKEVEAGIQLGPAMMAYTAWQEKKNKGG